MFVMVRFLLSHKIFQTILFEHQRIVHACVLQMISIKLEMVLSEIVASMEIQQSNMKNIWLFL